MSHKPNNVTSPGLGIPGYAPGARPGGGTRRASGGRSSRRAAGHSPNSYATAQSDLANRLGSHQWDAQCSSSKPNRTNRITTQQWIMDIGTWNVTSLAGKEKELVEEVEKYRLDIVGLSSTHSKGSGTVNLERGWTLYYSGVNVQERGKAGVGILTSPRLTPCVLEWIPEDERVCAIQDRIPRGKIITFISVYAPNNEADYQVFSTK